MEGTWRGNRPGGGGEELGYRQAAAPLPPSRLWWSPPRPQPRPWLPSRPSCPHPSTERRQRVCASPEVPWRATQGRGATTGVGIKQTGLKSCLHCLPGGGEGTSLCSHRKNRGTIFLVGFWVRIKCSNVTMPSTRQQLNKSTTTNNSNYNFCNYEY